MIQWMYPYLEPHGLIMKINPEMIQMKSGMAMVNNDLDFWDWYTRRLIGDRKFRRDIVARKSFSKLRSAIGGAYAFRGMLKEAETAFREALVLYPYSPEANFRLAAEVYSRTRRYRDGQRLMIELLKGDPANATAADFIKRMEGTIGLDQQRETLEQSVGVQPTDQASALAYIENRLKLIQVYFQLGQPQQALQHADQLLAIPDLPPNSLFQLAGIYRQAKAYPKMDVSIQKALATVKRAGQQLPANLYLQLSQFYAEATRYDQVAALLQLYLKEFPADFNSWLNLAAANVALKNHAAAYPALEQALKLNNSDVFRVLSTDRRFVALHTETRFSYLMKKYQPRQF